MEVHNLTADAETFTANAYLALGDGATLVDAGAMDGVVDAVREHTDTLDSVVLTHQHYDHVEKLPEVVAAFDPEVYAYAPHDLRTVAVDGGDTVNIAGEPFETVHTPGHADDHLSFFSPSTLFSGDAVVHDDGAYDDGSFGRTDKPRQSRDTLIDGIERLLTLLPDSVEYMYSGHGGAFHGDVSEVVQRALRRAKRREPKYPEE